MGHIEDVVVDVNTQGKKVGQKIIKDLLEHGKSMNCRKTILDCEIKLIPFYQKNNMKVSSIGMRYDYK